MIYSKKSILDKKRPEYQNSGLTIMYTDMLVFISVYDFVIIFPCKF